MRARAAVLIGLNLVIAGVAAALVLAAPGTAPVAAGADIDGVSQIVQRQVVGPPPPPPPPPPPGGGCEGGTITIVDNGPAFPYPSICGVWGRSGTITDLNLRIMGLSHTWPDDIDMLLVGPGGKNAKVFSDAGGSLDVVSAWPLTLDDEAATQLPDSAQISTGSYRPADYEPGTDIFPAPAPVPSGNVNLSVFDGLSPNDTWNLYIVDDAGADVGDIYLWTLDITTSGGPPPPPPPLPPPPPPPGPPPPPPPPPPVRCLVPRVLGLRLGAAKRKIRQRHCTLGRVRAARSRRVGRVIGQRPRAGAVKRRGYPVALIVGRR